MGIEPVGKMSLPSMPRSLSSDLNMSRVRSAFIQENMMDLPWVYRFRLPLTADEQALKRAEASLREAFSADQVREKAVKGASR
ncbi:MAG TPA: hypothetical protein VHX86_16190 [Tepidisphaeraceae bacterium]|jgi:hypothetical protein|nr:hypothetical protein [Tepidisphaeraceae bacterium]